MNSTMLNFRNALLALFLMGTVATVSAQKYAYVDSDYVLAHLPQYSEAQSELNALAKDWLGEIEEKLSAAAHLETAYRAERVLLTPEMRRKREDAIASKRTEATDMQKAKFGVEGELFQKRQELIQPVQDEIFQVLKDLSAARGYMVIFDKSKQSNMLYTNPKYDISDRVIKELGFTPGETIEEEEPERGETLQDRVDGVLDKGKDKVNDAKNDMRNRGSMGSGATEQRSKQ
jgi:outer membrane protein